ncbi:MAG: DUF6382 domain-containing protein [Lachnospiraceae bacterium]|nr:DUF6382 domain-containing protein [Lachnospiraceae bacterium]
MKTEYKRDLQNNYLVLEVAEMDEEEGYGLRMAEQNQVKGLLPMHESKRDGKLYLHYEITSRQTLESMYEKKVMSYQDILSILSGIHDTLEDMRKYLLSPQKLLFAPELIYVLPERGGLLLCYYAKEDEYPITMLAEFILKRLDHRDRQAVTLGYGFFQQANGANFSLANALKEILSVSGEAGRAAAAHRADGAPAGGNVKTTLSRRDYGNGKGKGEFSGGRTGNSKGEYPGGVYGNVRADTPNGGYGNVREDVPNGVYGNVGTDVLNGVYGNAGVKAPNGGYGNVGADIPGVGYGNARADVSNGSYGNVGVNAPNGGYGNARTGAPNGGYGNVRTETRKRGYGGDRIPGESVIQADDIAVKGRRQKRKADRPDLADRLFAKIHPAVLLTFLALMIVLELVIALDMLGLTEAGGCFFLTAAVEGLLNRRLLRKKTQDSRSLEDEEEEENEEYERLIREAYRQENRAEPEPVEETVYLPSEEREERLRLIWSRRKTMEEDGQEMPDIYPGEDPLYIGKIKGEADVILHSATVSRMHARIQIREGKCYLKDMNSKNGTFVNGQRLALQEEQEIKQDDTVSFSDVEYRVVKD